MPTPPNPPVISGQTTWAPVDAAGVPLDGQKLSVMPASLYETDGYTERLDENGWEVVRYWNCAWSDVAASMQWFYGYSFLSSQADINLLFGRGFGGDPINLGVGKIVNIPVPTLNRVIPAQDPYRPYLYCDHVEVMDRGGAWLQDPGLFLRDVAGNLLDVNGKLVPGTFPGQDGRIPGGFGPQGQATVPGSVRVPGVVFAERVGGAVAPLPRAGGLDPGAGPLTFPPGQLGGGFVQPPPVNLIQAAPIPVGNFSDGMARLRARYRNRPYIVMNDVQLASFGYSEMGRYVEREPNYALQGVPIPTLQGGKQVKFVEGPFKGSDIGQSGILLMPTQSWTYWWHDVPFYPSPALASARSGGVMGGVNQAPFDDLQGWPQFPAQTLLCQAPAIQWRRNACGQVAFKIGWRLDYRPDGWNKFPTPKGFFTATTDGNPVAADGSNLVFPPVDFDKLFKVAPGNNQGFFWG